MARNLHAGEIVFIPKSKIGLPNTDGSAFRECRVTEVHDRKITIDLVHEGFNVQVAASAAHRNIGFLLVKIGDFQTEDTLLDPLAKSVLQFARILVADDFVRRIDIRTLRELQKFWATNHGAYSHVIFIGHGSREKFLFEVNNETTGADFVKALNIEGVQPKTIISLACETGKAPIAQITSKSTVCQSYIAPYNSVHGVDSSLFVQMFMNKHLLDGLSTKVAFNQTYAAIARCKFRIWQNGNLKAGYHSR